MATPTLQQAGHRLRTLREEQKLTMENVVAQSRGAITQQQISRIETGKIDKPPMQDLVLLGSLVGLNPTEVALLYGYWQPTSGAELAATEEPPILVRVRRLLMTLPPIPKQVLLHWLDFAVGQAMAAVAPDLPDTEAAAVER